MGFHYLSMWEYLCMSVFGLDGSGNAAVGGAGVEVFSFGDTFTCFSPFALRFLQVPHDGFGCIMDQ